MEAVEEDGPAADASRPGWERALSAALGLIVLVPSVIVLGLPEFGVSLELTQRLGGLLGSNILGSLGLVAGGILLCGAARSRPAEAGRGGRVAGVHALGTTGLVLGPVVVLLPAFGLQVSPLSASQTPILGFGILAAGLGLTFLGLALDPVEDGEQEPLPSAMTWLKELVTLRFFPISWRLLDREASRERAARGGRYDWRPLTVFCLGAVFLTMMETFGHAPAFRELAYHPGLTEEPGLWTLIRDSPFGPPVRGNVSLLGFAWWSGWRLLGFFLLPALVVRVIFGQRIAAYGLSTEGFREHLWLYLLAYAAVAGLVLGVSYGPSFSEYYPFYKLASRSWYDFLAWEMLYAGQFFRLEYFFRGFWLKAAKPSMGSHAIYAMIVPYCMIHFGKPYAEILMAIIAGLFLGTLALRTRSIWGGFVVHVLVAVTMDVASLWQSEGLPTQWWPFP
ncbi:MAG: CPBP family intramembrane glutamic endopeptidase [Sandaracinaceae bacterium]